MNRQERRRQAKLNKKNAKASGIRHILHKQNGATLDSFYWGWKADKHPEGFEFSTKTLMHFGMDVDTANKIGANIKEASDNQLQELVNDNTMEYAGLSRPMFIIEEERRLKQSVDTFNAVVQSGPFALDSMMPHIMVICCAISTLVAVGKIQQDTWNGDSFGYGYTDYKKYLDTVEVA
jgi:hypothetical protein